MLKRLAAFVVLCLFAALTAHAATIITRTKTLGFTPIHCTGGGYIVPFDADIQGLMTRLGAGATLCFQPGTYYIGDHGSTGVLAMYPVINQTLNCAGTAGSCILDAGRVITGWAHVGSNYVAQGFLPAINPGGTVPCNSGFTLCNVFNDIYLDTTRLSPVTSVSALATGKFYLDYANNLIFIRDDPTGKTAVQAYMNGVFWGNAIVGNTNVTMTGLTIQHVATRGQTGAVDTRHGYVGPFTSWDAGWTLDHMTVQWSHGAAIELSGSSITNCALNDNGQEGYIIGGNNSVMSYCEIARNNWANFSIGFEAGGGKGVQTVNWVADHNNVHDNNGTGLWCDIACFNTEFNYNTVTNNVGVGIDYEISDTVSIQFNTITNNSVDNGLGFGAFDLDGAQILIYSSSHATVAYNTVNMVGIARANGIGGNNSARTDSCTNFTGGTTYPNGALICTGTTVISGVNTPYHKFEFNNFNNNYITTTNPKPTVRATTNMLLGVADNVGDLTTTNATTTFDYDTVCVQEPSTGFPETMNIQWQGRATFNWHYWTTIFGQEAHGWLLRTGSGGTCAVPTLPAPVADTLASYMNALAGHAIPQAYLIFDDQFQGTSLLTTQWLNYASTAAAGGRWTNAGLLAAPLSGYPSGSYQASYYNPANITVSSGLTLQAVPDITQTGYTWSGAALTLNYQTQKGYTYYQIKATMPDSQYGAWARFDLFQQATGGTQEVDAETGYTGFGTPVNNHWSQFIAGPAGIARVGPNVGFDMSAGTHIYGIEYQFNRIVVFYVDGVEVTRWVTGARPTVAMNLVIHMDIASAAANAFHTTVSGSTANPTTMHIDEVSIYASGG
jgi:hypothetical protein